MPGLFDNFGPAFAGNLSGFGGVLGSIGRGLAGGQNYNTMSQAMGDPRAALMAQTDPRAFQTLMFMQQLRAIQQQNPGMSLNQALFQASPKGQEQQFGVEPFGTYTDPSGASGPGVRTGMTVTPPFSGFNTPQPTPQMTAPASSLVGATQRQATPGQGGPATAGPIMPDMQRRAIDYKSELAGSEEAARKQADSLQQYPNALVTAQDAVKRLEALKANPNLSSVVGGPLGIKGRTRPIGQDQADLVNEINELQGKIIGNTLNASRSVSGRPVTPGALKELTVGAGDLIAGRTGTVQGYQKIIDNSIDLIKKETGAAWEATGKKGAEPNWGPPDSTTPKQQYPEGTIAINKQTGEKRILRAGHWTAP